jgi:uncharacterized membrane protein YbhN (UPF0104 family)
MGVSEDESFDMRLNRTTQVLVSLLALAAVVVAAAMPQLLQGRVAAAIDALGGADPHWLWLAALGYVGGFVCTVASWRAALAAAGGKICPRQAAARLGVGSLVNTFAPAKIGDAVKVALCAKAIEGPQRIWTTGGVYAGLAAARSIMLALLLIVASATGALPLWPVFVLLGMAGTLAVVASSSTRWRRHPRIARLLEGFAALERSPRAIATVLGWTAGMVVCRFAATVAAAAALGLPHPVLAALVIMPALDVAAAIPLTPGNIGIGSGAVAMALASRGIGTSQALGVAFAIQAVETLVGVSIGTLGAAYLTKPSPVVRRWAMRAGALAGSATLAAGLGAYMAGVI